MVTRVFGEITAYLECLDHISVVQVPFMTSGAVLDSD